MIKNPVFIFTHLMLPTKNQILHLILFCTTLLFFFSITPVAAHVEEDNMPDSVAEIEYRILLEFEPDNLEVRIKLGMVLYRSGKFDEAASEFNHVLKKNPKNVEALISLARVNIKLLNHEQATTLLQKALPMDPEDMHIYYYLGQALELQGDATGAEDVYKKGISQELSPQNKHAAEERPLLVEALKNLQEHKEKTLRHNN